MAEPDVRAEVHEAAEAARTTRACAQRMLDYLAAAARGSDRHEVLPGAILIGCATSAPGACLHAIASWRPPSCAREVIVEI